MFDYLNMFKSVVGLLIWYALLSVQSDLFNMDYGNNIVLMALISIGYAVSLVLYGYALAYFTLDLTRALRDKTYIDTKPYTPSKLLNRNYNKHTANFLNMSLKPIMIVMLLAVNIHIISHL